MSRAEESHRHAVIGRDSQGDPCTAIVYRLTAEHEGRMVRVVVVSVNATERGAVAFSPGQATEVAEALYSAAGTAKASERKGRADADQD